MSLLEQIEIERPKLGGASPVKDFSEACSGRGRLENAVPEDSGQTRRESPVPAEESIGDWERNLAEPEKRTLEPGERGGAGGTV